MLIAMARAAIYARISQDRTGEELGISRQLEACRKLAEAKLFDEWVEFSDDDVSAFSGKERPGYKALVRAIERNEVQAVIVWHSDRLHRRTDELAGYLRLCAKGRNVPTYSVEGGDLDPSSPTGVMVATILGAVAEQESAHKGRRVAEKRRQAAEHGIWQGGPVPFGWDMEQREDDNGVVRSFPVVNEEQAKWVEYAHRAILRGDSITSLVKHFNEQNVPTPRGGQWRASTLRSMLRRSRNCGIESLHEEEIGPSEFPELVDESLWRGVMARLGDPSRKTYRDNSVKHLLSGIALCHCGTPVTARNSSQGELKYVCKELSGPHGQGNKNKVSSHVARQAEPVNEYISGVIPGLLADRARDFGLVSENSASAHAELRDKQVALEARAAELADMLSDGELSRKQFARANENVTAKLAEVESSIADLGQREEFASSVVEQAVEAWGEMSIERKREVLRQAFTITLRPTGRGSHWKKPAALFVDVHLKLHDRSWLLRVEEAEEGSTVGERGVTPNSELGAGLQRLAVR